VTIQPTAKLSLRVHDLYQGYFTKQTIKKMVEIYEYMAPRYPTYIFNEPETIEECMPIARHIVATKDTGALWGKPFQKGTRC
jgi:hypothetical protein